MTGTIRHWTENSVKDFLYRIAADFVSQLEERMQTIPLTKAGLADKLQVTKGRVSQILNNPGNLTLEKVIQYARAVGMKVAIVAYDDNDPDNERGPINSDIFRICWERQNKPTEFWALLENQMLEPAEERRTVPAGLGVYILPPGTGTNRQRGSAAPDLLNVGLDSIRDRFAGNTERMDEGIPEQTSAQNLVAKLGR